MPSGAKKRKAAKKKKENQPGNYPNPSSAATHSHGGHDVKRQDDKESDVGEVSSPASQDHHSQHSLLTEGEEEEYEKRENISNLPSIKGAKIEVVGERNIVVEDTAFPVEREFRIGKEPDKKGEKFEHDEPARKSYDGGSSGSSGSGSSSNSDDESHGTKSGQAVVDIFPVGDSVKVADTYSKEHVEAIESTTAKGASDSIVENVSKENGEKKQSFIKDLLGISEAIKDTTSQREETVVPSVENVSQEPNDCLNLSYDAPTVTYDNGRDAMKDSGVTEPLLVPASNPVQMTSWKGCCGLFEVFTGSGR